MIGLKHIQDFYVLEKLNHVTKLTSQKTMSRKDTKLYDDVADAFAILSRLLAESMYQYLTLASIGESRHASQQLARSYYVPELMGGEREESYKEAKGYNQVQSLTLLKEVIFFQDWDDGYGGPKWREIVEGALMYGKVPDAVFIDHCVDLQHNGGTAFSKPTYGFLHFSLDFTDLHSYLELKSNYDVLKLYKYGDEDCFDIELQPSTITLLHRAGYKADLFKDSKDHPYWEPIHFDNNELHYKRKCTDWRNVCSKGNTVSAKELAHLSVESIHMSSQKIFIKKYGKDEKAKAVKENTEKELEKNLEKLLSDKGEFLVGDWSDVESKAKKLLWKKGGAA